MAQNIRKRKKIETFDIVNVCILTLLIWSVNYIKIERTICSI